MNVKLKENKMLNADFKSHGIVLAEFSSNLSEQGKKEIISIINYGSKMIRIYENFRERNNIHDISSMINEMEKIYGEYSYDKYANRRIPNKISKPTQKYENWVNEDEDKYDYDME